MAGYNLTVQLNLQGPKNLNSIIGNINKRLNNIQANVNVKVAPQAAQAMQAISSSSKAVQQSANAAAGSMEKFGQSAGLAVKRFAAFTAATAGFYAVTRATTQSLERFIEYDRQLTRIAQVTGTTKASLSGLSNTITQLSTTFGASSASLAQVAVTLSQAGLSAKQAEQALKSLALTTLAPTFNDINQTVEGSIALMKQFSISTTQLESALGSINAVAGQFAVEASDIITAIQRTGGVFAAASNGVSQGTDALNEFIAVFTSVRATTRESAETIATGLRTIFSRIQREDTIEALKAFGVQLTDLEGKFVGPYVAIQRLAEGLRSLDPRDLQFSSLVEELGGFRQVGKVIPLIQQFTTAQQALNVAQRGSGSLAQDAATGQQALAVQIAKVQQEFDALIRSIGQTAEFQQFIRLSLDLASALIKVADAIKPLAPALAALGAASFARGIPSIGRGLKKGLGFAGGGMVPGSGNRDTVPAMLTPGEFVIRKKAVSAIGVKNLSKVNKYGVGGPVSLTGQELSRTYGSLRSLVDMEQVYRANVIDHPVPTQFVIKSMKARKSKNKSMPAWRNFELAVGSKYGFQAGSGNSYLDYPSVPGEAKFLRPGQGYASDPETGFIKGNNKETMLAKLVGSGIYREGQKVHVYYPQNLYDLQKNLFTSDEKEQKRRDRRTAGIISKGGKPIVRRASGGGISGQDTVPAMLTPGEFVINKKAASRLGSKTLNNLNRADKVSGYNSGGSVGTIPGYAAGGNVGNTIGLALLLQGAAGMFATSIEDAANVGAAQIGGSIEGAISGLNTALIGGQIAGMAPGAGKLVGALGKLAGPLGVISVAAVAAAAAVIRFNNASIDFANKLDQQNIDQATDRISKGFETLRKDADSLGAIREIRSGIVEATTATRQMRNREIEGGRLGWTNLPEYIYNSFQDKNQERDALSAQRALVLEKKGISAYLGTTSLFGGGEAFARSSLSKEIREINKTRSVDSAKQFGEIADLATQLITQRLQQGMNFEDILDSAAFKEFSEALARSNPEVERYILNTQANNSLSQEEKDARIQNVISSRAETEARQRTAAVRKQIEIDSAASVGRNLESILTRVFNNMDQAFSAAAISLKQKFDIIDLNMQSLSGKPSIGIGADINKSVLESPRAYSQDRFKSVVNSLRPLMGDQADLIGNLATASTDLEDKIISSINSAIKNNPDATPEAISGMVRKDIYSIVQDLNLPQELASALSQQIIAGIADLQTKGKDKIGLDSYDVRSSISGFGQTIDGLGGSMETLKKANNLYRSALEGYVSASNKITEALVSRSQYLQNAFDIAANSAIKLQEAFGRVVTASDVRAQENARIGNMTGGLTDPGQVFSSILDLNARRQILQGRQDAASAGGPGSFDQFKQLNSQLISTNVELSNAQQALRSMAESSAVADAALSDIARQQEKRQQQAGFLEGLVSSTPEQMQSLNQAYADMQRLLSGQSNTIYTSIEAQKAYIETLRSARYDPINGSPQQQAERAAQGVLAQERGNVLSLVKELGPFLGSSQEANNLRADILGTQLNQLGLLTPKFAAVIEAIRNPQADPETQRAISIYQQAVDKQVEANGYLSKLQELAAAQAQRDIGLSVAQAMQAITLNVNVMNANDIARGIQPVAVAAPVGRSSGGVIYASEGQMMPRGTDTVPAMLTPGEFVVNKQATAKNRGLLENINSGKTRYYSYGGYVSRAFNEGVSRAKAEGLSPLTEWEQWNSDFTRKSSKELWTSKNFMRFNGPDLVVPNYVPQKDYADIDKLKRGIINHFGKGEIFPGIVPELVVENIGKFDPEEANSSTAGKIADAIQKLQIPYSGTYQDASGNYILPNSITKFGDSINPYKSAIASQAGITEDTLQTYISREYAGKNKDKINVYPDRVSSANIMQKINPRALGWYGLADTSPASKSTGEDVTAKDFASYKANFNRLTGFVQMPRLPEISDDMPNAKPNLWNVRDGKYHGLYDAFGSSGEGGEKWGLGAENIYGWTRWSDNTFRLYNGGDGIRFEGLPYTDNKYSTIAQNSQNIFDLVAAHRNILNQGLQADPAAQKFINDLDKIYGGTPTVNFSDSSRFFRGTPATIVGLSESLYSKYSQKVKEGKYNEAIPWGLSYKGIEKKLGLLTDSDDIDRLKDLDLEKAAAEEDIKKYKITPAIHNERLNIPVPRDLVRTLRSRFISGNMQLPYNRYSGMLYDDDRQNFLSTGIYNKIIPAFNEYDSFLNKKQDNDLMYSSLPDFGNAIKKGLNIPNLINYIFNDDNYDGNVNLGAYGHFGSQKKENFYTRFGGNQTRHFSILKELQPSIDAIKNNLPADAAGVPEGPFVDPKNRMSTEQIFIGRYNDMLGDSLRFWGGIRGRMAGQLNRDRISRTDDMNLARSHAASIREMFLVEANGNMGQQHLYYRAHARGYADVWGALGTGVMDAFTRVSRDRVDVDTFGAALSFAQKYYMDESASGLGLPPNNAIVDAAVEATAGPGGGLAPKEFSGLWELFLNPYKKHNASSRAPGLKAIWEYMTQKDYYTRTRRGVIPSAQEASMYYGNLIKWYTGIAAWTGQDVISEQLSGLEDETNKADKFLDYILPGGIYQASENSHIKLGAGIFGPLPSLEDIAKINGISRGALALAQRRRVRAGRGLPAQGFSEGGVVALDRALAERAGAVNVDFGSSAKTDYVQTPYGVWPRAFAPFADDNTPSNPASSARTTAPTTQGYEAKKAEFNVRAEKTEVIPTPKPESSGPVRRTFPDSKPRRWINSRGDTSMVGTLAAVEGDTAVIVDQKGRRLNVPMRNLSSFDAAHATTQFENWKPQVEVGGIPSSSTTGMNLPSTQLSDRTDVKPIVTQQPTPPKTKQQIDEEAWLNSASPTTPVAPISLTSLDSVMREAQAVNAEQTFSRYSPESLESLRPDPRTAAEADNQAARNALDPAYQRKLRDAQIQAQYDNLDWNRWEVGGYEDQSGQSWTESWWTGGQGVGRRYGDPHEADFRNPDSPFYGQMPPGTIYTKDGKPISSLRDATSADAFAGQVAGSVLVPGLGASYAIQGGAGSAYRIGTGQGTVQDALNIAGLPLAVGATGSVSAVRNVGRDVGNFVRNPNRYLNALDEWAGTNTGGRNAPRPLFPASPSPSPRPSTTTPTSTGSATTSAPQARPTGATSSRVDKAVADFLERENARAATSVTPPMSTVMDTGLPTSSAGSGYRMFGTIGYGRPINVGNGSNVFSTIGTTLDDIPSGPLPKPPPMRGKGGRFVSSENMGETYTIPASRSSGGRFTKPTTGTWELLGNDNPGMLTSVVDTGPFPQFTTQALYPRSLDMLVRYRFPGNVRAPYDPDIPFAADPNDFYQFIGPKVGKAPQPDLSGGVDFTKTVRDATVRQLIEQAMEMESVKAAADAERAATAASNAGRITAKGTKQPSAGTASFKPKSLTELKDEAGLKPVTGRTIGTGSQTFTVTSPKVPGGSITVRADSANMARQIAYKKFLDESGYNTGVTYSDFKAAPYVATKPLYGSGTGPVSGAQGAKPVVSTPRSVASSVEDQSFRYMGIDATNGRKVSGNISADNYSAAKDLLRKKGWLITSLHRNTNTNTGTFWDRYVRAPLGYANGGIVSPNYLAVGGVATARLAPGPKPEDWRNFPITYSGGPIFRPWRQGTGTGYTGRDEYKDRTAYGLKKFDEFWDRPENRNLLIDSPQAQEQYRLQKLAISKGFGYDAVGRPGFDNSIDPYGDPRASKKDLAALFDDPNDNIGWDTEIGFSGGAFGSYARTIGKYANGGKVQYLANGGQLVNYQPQGTDTVPAMLTPGEFVVNRSATQKHLPLLNAINKSKGGTISPNYLYGGGVATARLAPGPRAEDWRNFPMTYGGGPIVRSWRQGGAADEYTDLAYWKKNQLQQNYGWMRNGTPSQQQQYRQMEFAIEKGYGLDALGRSVFNNPISKYTDPMASLVDLEILRSGGNPGRSFYGQPGMRGGSQRFLFGYGGGSSSRNIPGLYNRGGKVSYLANGGQLVNYAPQGTDTVPAMLTPGEFVVNKKATRQNLGLLQAINKSSGGKINNGILYAANGTDGPVSATMGGGGGTIQVTVQNPTIDFSEFTSAVSSFSNIVGQFASPIEKLAGVDFGVINTGATNFSNAMQNFSTTSQTLGSQISRFNTAVNNFSNKTNEFISSINNLKLNGTITVQGSIAMQPLTVNIAGLESIEARIQGMAGLVARSLARGLATSNPGMDVSQITTSDSYYS